MRARTFNIILIAAWILGPLVIFFLVRRRLKLDAAAKAAAEKAKAAPKTDEAVDVEELLESSKIRRRQRPSSSAEPTPPSSFPGFRELKWGQTMPPGMKTVHEEGDECLCIKNGEDLKVDGVVANSISYSFYMNRFQAVIVEFSVFSFDSLSKKLSATWGKPQISRNGERCSWSSMMSGPEATEVLLQKRMENRTAVLTISSKQIREEKAKATGSPN